MDRQAFAAIVRESRGDLSQKEFAQILGCSQAIITHWERGLVNPRLGTLEALAKLRGVTLVELVQEIQ